MSRAVGRYEANSHRCATQRLPQIAPFAGACKGLKHSLEHDTYNGARALSMAEANLNRTYPMSIAGCSTTSRHVQPAPGRGGHWISPVQRNSGLMVPASNLLTGIVSGFTCGGRDYPDSGGRRAVTPNERIVGMTRSGSPKLRMCRAHMSTVIILRRQAHHAALANQTPAQRRMSS